MAVFGAVHWWPTGNDVERFLNSFWPAFVATLLGVVVGIPAALFINRRVEDRRLKSDAAEETGRRAEFEALRAARRKLIARLLLISVRDNRNAIAGISRDIGQADSVIMTTGFDVATWEVAKDEVIELFADVGLRATIARFYENVGYLAVQVRDYREYLIGLPSTLSRAGDFRKAIYESFQASAKKLLDNIPSLMERLAAVAEVELDVDEQEGGTDAASEPAS
jgi:hypothetical protein